MGISMEFGVKNNASGKVAKFGAIFMSNSATKKECCRRKLLGLPLGQADFVKQVKSGMILFLFEFENRELHGVFQACSDGAINIVPHAFKSSGKQFPSQVKFTPIWHCSPLSESEFCDAIKENYFSANKFNFGLSEKQVQKLLSLFSLRKIKDNHLQRHFTRSEVERPIGHHLHKDRNAIDAGSFLTINDGKDDEQHTDANFDSVTNYIQQVKNSLGGVGRAVDGGHYGTDYTKGNERDMDIDASSVVRELTIQKSNLDASSLINDQLQQSMMHSPMESQYLNASYSATTRDAVTSITSYDLDVPALNYSHLSLPEFSRDNIFPRLGNQSLSSDVEPKCMSRYADINSGLFDNVISSGPNLCEYSDKVSKLFPGATYPGNTYDNNRNLSSVPSRFSEIRNNIRTNEGASFSYSPSKFLSCAFDSRYPVASLEKHDHKLLPFENNEAFVADVPVMEKDNTRSVVCHEKTSMNLDISDSEKMYSFRPKRRCNVFSRLSLPPKASEQGNGTQIQHDETRVDSSVDEIMAMLYQCRHKWVKETSFEKPITRHDDITNKANKRPVNMISKWDTNKISEEIRRNFVSTNEENVVQVAESIPFVDFKRRREVRKAEDDASSGGCKVKFQSDGSSGVQHKRRKLIRPKFSMNESSGDVTLRSQDKQAQQVFELLHDGIQKNVENDQTPCIGCEDKNVDAKKDSSYEKEKIMESCVASFRNSDEDREGESLSVGISGVPFSGFCKVESFGVEESSTFKNLQDDGSSQKYGVTFSDFCKVESSDVEESSTFKNLQDDGSSLRENDFSCSIFQEPILGLYEEISVTVAYDGLDIDGDSIQSFQNLEVENKSCQIGGDDGSTWRSSMKHNFELEKLNQELGSVNSSTQQQLSVEPGTVTVTGLCKTSTNMQEPSQGVCDENDEKRRGIGRNCRKKL